LRHHVNTFTDAFILTGKSNNGTECCYLASKKLDAEIIINIQGDSPLSNPQDIRRCWEELVWFSGFDTIVTPHYWSTEKNSVNRVKCVMGKGGNVLYYSRSDIPHNADKLAIHIGEYYFWKHTLEKIYTLRGQLIEQDLNSERLEQLFWLSIGIPIKSIECKPTLSIDTREDYERFLKIIRKQK